MQSALIVLCAVSLYTESVHILEPVMVVSLVSCEKVHISASELRVVFGNEKEKHFS